MKDARLAGRFTAAGGRDEAVEVLLTTDADFPNWENGHEAEILYSTHGLKTTDRFDVPLDRGSYVLVFSNRAAILLNRYVAAEVDLKYLGSTKPSKLWWGR